MNWVKYVEQIQVWPHRGAEPHRICLRLERRGTDTWALVRYPFRDVWNKNEGRFVYEPSPSNRDEEFLNNCRFDLFAAYLLAMNIINGDLRDSMLDLGLLYPDNIALSMENASDLGKILNCVNPDNEEYSSKKE
jgi:hypothetical protein